MQQPKAENQPEAFHKFGKLVPELRRLIWQTAIDMRSDEIYLHRNYEHNVWKPARRRARFHDPVAQTNKEAREIALRGYAYIWRDEDGTLLHYAEGRVRLFEENKFMTSNPCKSLLEINRSIICLTDYSFADKLQVFCRHCYNSVFDYCSDTRPLCHKNTMFKGLALPIRHWRDPDPSLASQSDIPNFPRSTNNKTRISSLLRKLNGIKEIFIVVENEDACRYTDVTFEPPTGSPGETFCGWEFEWPEWFQTTSKNERPREEELKSSWPAMTRRLETILMEFREKRRSLIADLKEEPGGVVTHYTDCLESWEIPKIRYVNAISEKSVLRNVFRAWESLGVIDFEEED